MKSNNIKGEWWFYVLVWCLSVWGQLFLILSLVRVMGWNMSPTMIVITILVVPLIDAIVGYMLYKKREGERLKRYFYKQSQAIKEDVAKILSLGGICSQIDADGWQEYRCYDWGDVIKCYIKNIDDHNKVLVICPISFSFGSREVASLKRIVDDIAYDKIIKSEIVFGADAWAYLEICIDMSDVVFAQPYYHRLSECIGCVYCPVDSYLSETYVAH